MKRNVAWVFAVLLLLPGCFGKKNDKKGRRGKKKTEMVAEVDIPVVTEDMKSYFDDDVNEFALLDDDSINEEFDFAQDVSVDEFEQAAMDELDEDFFWIEDLDEKDESFKAVYFEFDKDGIKEDQAETVDHDIEVAKNLIDRGENPVITVEGNACSSSGSRSYNLALSNNRAKVVADRFIDNGIPSENVKIVGRGVDNPALDEFGNPVDGDRDQQWPNRRVEVRVYS